MRFTLRGNSEGLEDYLEAVLILEEKQIRVRCVDVAKGEGAALSLTEEGAP